MSYYVYRLFDADQQCLYVGASANVGFRMQRHVQREWGAAIRRVDATLHDSRMEAQDVERQEIARLAPLHNVIRYDGSLGSRAFGRGELMRLCVRALTECGPMTNSEMREWIADQGLDGLTQSNIGTVLTRLVQLGEASVVDERPSTSGRWKTVRVYGVAA